MVIYDVTHKHSFDDVPKLLQDIDEVITDISREIVR